MTGKEVDGDFDFPKHSVAYMVDTMKELADGWTTQTSGIEVPKKGIIFVMVIEEDFKLDFPSVLIRPKRSTLKSRKEVDLFRTTIFRNSKRRIYRYSYHGYKHGWSWYV